MPAYFIFPPFTSFSEYNVKMTQAVSVSADTHCLSSNVSQIYAHSAHGDTKITVVPAQTERESDSSGSGRELPASTVNQAQEIASLWLLSVFPSSRVISFPPEFLFLVISFTLLFSMGTYRPFGDI